MADHDDRDDAPPPIELNVHLGEVHIHVHVHTDPAGDTPPSSILLAIQAASKEVLSAMSKVQDALAAQSKTDDALAGEITQLVGVVQGFAAQEASDLKAALTAAGIDDDTNASIVDASTKRLQGFADQIAAVLPPVAPAPVALAVTGPLMISGSTGSPLSGSFAAEGGTAPYTWAASENPGDIEVGTDGGITGTPQSPEAGDFDVTVTDSTGASASASVAYSITAA